MTHAAKKTGGKETKAPAPNKAQESDKANIVGGGSKSREPKTEELRGGTGSPSKQAK